MSEAIKNLLPASAINSENDAERGKPLIVSALAALGVVYGDIGTSPLYACKNAFRESHGVAPTLENVVGVLSLIILVAYYRRFGQVSAVHPAGGQPRGGRDHRAGRAARPLATPPGSRGGIS